MYKKRVQRNKEKAFHIGIPLFKLVFLVLLVCGLFLTVWQQPHVHPLDPSSRWISNPRYISNVDVNWDDVMKVIHKLKDYQAVGLLNFNDTEIIYWKHLVPDVVTQHVVQLHPVGKNVTWESLYPEWIDEQQQKEIPICPSLPKSHVPTTMLDLLVIKLPSKNGSNWSRDVPRLHLQLAAANIAASSSKGVHLLFVADRFPVPNLFPCKELVARHGNVWLFKPDLNVLRHTLQLPVGSCELALPLRDTVPLYRGNPRREAYATILHSAHVYVCGAIAAAQSIQLSGSTQDLIILVDESISAYHRSGLEAAGWKIRTIQRIRNPKAEKDAYNEWNYSKFRLWQLTDYDKIIFIDADLLILRNIDFLFGMPEISATGNNATLFNSGVMVIEPSNCTFELLMEHIDEIESYNGGDQGYLNEVFTWWHRIPKHVNFLKHFWVGDEEEVKQMKIRLFGAEPPVLYVLHYLGIKPWLCFRDYDCNWNSDIFQEFASDTAHEKWWRVHDKMPAELHQFCDLQSKQKAQLEWDRREAEKGKYRDGHWRIKIKDKRLKKCVDKLCNWRSMLRHWGETNWTDVDDFFNQTPPALSTASLPAL